MSRKSTSETREQGIEFEEMAVSLVDGHTTVEECAGDEAWAALYNAVIDHMASADDMWDICEERDGWAYASDDVTPEWMDATRAVRIFVDGIDQGGFFYQVEG